MRCFLVAFVLAGAASPGAQPPEVLSGDYVEGRSNKVFGCYCEWSGESQTGGHQAILAWKIRSGAWRGTSLAGVRMAAVVVGESTLSQGNPSRKSVLVIDSSASPAQRDGAEALLRERFAELLGRVIDIHGIPVRIDVAAESATLKVGNLVELALRRANLPDDALQGARLWYDPFVPLKESTLAVAMDNRYGGREFGTTWSWSEPGVTGYYGRFEIKLE